VPVVNLPGCARSAKPNSLDWVMRRLAAGIPVTPRDLMRTGAGGLLKEVGSPRIATRLPGFEPASGSNVPRIAAIVLADGDDDDAIRAVEAAVSADLAPVVVACPAEADLDCLPTCDVRILRGELPAALRELPEDVDATIVLRASDQATAPAHLAELVRAYDQDEGRGIIVTVRGAKRAGPMLIGRDFLPQLVQDATPDTLLADHAEMVFEVMA
jgi:molybdenum cofactor cytidylyltransferase